MNKPTFEEAELAVMTLLAYLGEDPDREGLKETPKRFLNAWKQHWGVGYTDDVTKHMKVFEEDSSEMVVVKDIPLYSHCEHHIAPIIGTCHIAYIPNGKVIGLSKLARVMETFARRLQIQERLTTQIAEALHKHLEPLGVGVIVEAEHLCMSSRGINKQGSKTITSKLTGCFEEPEVRNEFLLLTGVSNAR